MRLPEIQQALDEIAIDLAKKKDFATAQKIVALTAQMSRRVTRKRAPPTANTPETVKHDVRNYVVRNPNVPYRDVGRMFNIDGGRVSEIMAGLRR